EVHRHRTSICGKFKRSIQSFTMRQCCGSFSTGSLGKLKNAILPDYLPEYLWDYFLDHLCAPFMLLTLLACATGNGSAFAQSTASGVSQQASQPNSKTPGNEITSVQVSSGGYLGVYLGDVVNAERAKELGLKETRGAVVGRVEDGSPAAT